MFELLVCLKYHNIVQTINYLLCSQSMKLYSAFEMVFDVPIRWREKWFIYSVILANTDTNVATYVKWSSGLLNYIVLLGTIV